MSIVKELIQFLYDYHGIIRRIDQSENVEECKQFPQKTASLANLAK